MKNKSIKRILFSLFFFQLSLLCTPSVFGQKCSDYPCVIANVKKAMSAKNYRLAFEQLESAEGYPSKNVTQITELRKQLFSAVEKEKDEAKKQKDRAENLLKELRETSNQAVLLLLNEIDRNILKLEYDSTFEKCRIAVNLNSQNLEVEVKKRVLEIAYWYTETDTFNAALKTLKLLNINTLPNRNDLRKIIEANAPPQYFAFLEERYYPKMIKVEGGTFMMGDDEGNDDEKPAHPIKLGSFCIAETETTVWQYFLFQKATKYDEPEQAAWGWHGDNPIVTTRWYDAVTYCNWLSKRKKTGEVYEGEINNEVKTNFMTKGYRLPTEAEWEYAARGGNLSKGFEYSGSNNLDDIAWLYGNSNSRTQAVKTLKANELSLFDMSGNVREWCNDWYIPNFDINQKENPHGAEKGSERVVRGGSWFAGGINWRVSDRSDSDPFDRYFDLGFRCVRYD